LKGAYVLQETSSADLILTCAGAEFSFAFNVPETLSEKIISAEVISLPSQDY
ncbi:hypothetical protein B0J11DRAFT_439390, partial [Dendryphion nanum]